MKTICSRSRTLGLGFTLIFFWASSPAEATSIVVSNVVVTTNGATYGAASVGWIFPVTLSTGQDLVLTQDLQSGPTETTSYNFDTSDNTSGIPANPLIAITVDGVTTVFEDVNRVLSLKNEGGLPTQLNEAQNYGPALVGPGYEVFLGYADNVHTDACGQHASDLLLLGSSTCLPSPFSGAFKFEGTGGLVPSNPPGIIEPIDGFHCDQTGHNCYDAGVIRIVATANQVAVPEPATMLFTATGLVALGAKYRRRRRRDSSLCRMPT